MILKINTETSVEFTPEELKELISEKLIREGCKIVDISFNLKKRQWTEGHGTMEIDYEEMCFLGVKVNVKSK